MIFFFTNLVHVWKWTVVNERDMVQVRQKENKHKRLIYNAKNEFLVYAKQVFQIRGGVRFQPTIRPSPHPPPRPNRYPTKHRLFSPLGVVHLCNNNAVSSWKGSCFLTNAFTLKNKQLFTFWFFLTALSSMTKDYDIISKWRRRVTVVIHHLDVTCPQR